jgi:hypothetical protein
MALKIDTRVGIIMINRAVQIVGIWIKIISNKVVCFTIQIQSDKIMKMIKRRFKKNLTVINYQRTANFKKRMNLNARAIIKLQ